MNRDAFLKFTILYEVTDLCKMVLLRRVIRKNTKKARQSLAKTFSLFTSKAQKANRVNSE